MAPFFRGMQVAALFVPAPVAPKRWPERLYGLMVHLGVRPGLFGYWVNRTSKSFSEQKRKGELTPEFCGITSSDFA